LPVGETMMQRYASEYWFLAGEESACRGPVGRMTSEDENSISSVAGDSLVRQDVPHRLAGRRIVSSSSM
jgi:hypothetical protein